jgi:hypothetical protein
VLTEDQETKDKRAEARAQIQAKLDRERAQIQAKADRERLNAERYWKALAEMGPAVPKGKLAITDASLGFKDSHYGIVFSAVVTNNSANELSGVKIDVQIEDCAHYTYSIDETRYDRQIDGQIVGKKQATIHVNVPPKHARLLKRWICVSQTCPHHRMAIINPYAARIFYNKA